MARDITKYGVLTLTTVDPDDLTTEVTFKAAPMRLRLADGVLYPTWEVWRSASAFQNDEPSLGRFNKTFSVSGAGLATLRTAGTAFFTPFEAAIYTYVGELASAYDIEGYDINLTNLRIEATLKHKTVSGKTVRRRTLTDADFETIKTTFPLVVTRYFAFMKQYAKDNDLRLTRFTNGT